MPFVALDTFCPSSRRLVASPHRYAIADAHYAAGFFHWAAATGDNASVSRGVHFLDVLEASRCEGFDEFCWGYPFQWESRSGTVAAGTPLMTTVPYAYEAFELGFEATGRERYLRVMASIAAFASEHIPTTEFDDGSVAAGYTPSLATTVVNARLLPRLSPCGGREALCAARLDGSCPPKHCFCPANPSVRMRSWALRDASARRLRR